MSYVDIGWPLGLTVIGGLTWMYSEGDALRVAVVSIEMKCVAKTDLV
jgi:steroid 5-alpha reductase family enzyme